MLWMFLSPGMYNLALISADCGWWHYGSYGWQRGSLASFPPLAFPSLCCCSHAWYQLRLVPGCVCVSPITLATPRNPLGPALCSAAAKGRKCWPFPLKSKWVAQVMGNPVATHRSWQHEWQQQRGDGCLHTRCFLPFAAAAVNGAGSSEPNGQGRMGVSQSMSVRRSGIVSPCTLECSPSGKQRLRPRENQGLLWFIANGEAA